MIVKKIGFIVYVVAAVALLLSIVELATKQMNKARGEDLPLFYVKVNEERKRLGDGKFEAIDLHLGYAYSGTEERFERLEEPYQWIDGFAIYSEKPIRQLDRPIILTLGGSTTDALHSETSWPEELAKMLVAGDIRATVINGAVAGYTSSQELLKLVRDGVELHPDLVISYSGVNDRGAYGSLPNPMVHIYQREILESLLSVRGSRILPNTAHALARMVAKDTGQLTRSYGWKSERNRGEFYLRNMKLMHAIAEASGSSFLGIIQPNAYVGGYESRVDYESGGKPRSYQQITKSFYAELDDARPLPGFLHDFTKIFAGVEGVYKRDGIHTIGKGDRIIAENVLELIRRETALKL